MGRRAIYALSVALAVTTIVASCSSSDSSGSASKSEQVKLAIDALARGARLPQQPVDVPSSGTPGPSDSLANNVVGVKHLRRLENRECGGGALDAYEVPGDADALWRRMLRRSSDGELTKAETDANGQRIRYLRQTGFDYDTEVALSEGSRGTVLALRTCS